MTEEWRKIQGYDRYEVSNLGQVRRENKVSQCSHNGYYRVSLWKEGVKTNMYVHRLVALTFLPNPDAKPTVNHKDHNRKNNSLDNLEWATYQEQSLHSPSPLGVSGCRNIHPTKEGSWVVQIQRNRQSIFTKTFLTLSEAIKARDDFLRLCIPAVD